MHEYQFAVTYKDRKHINMFVTTQFNIRTCKELHLQWLSCTEKNLMFPVLFHIQPIHLKGYSYAYYNITHQLFDFCSLVTSHHLHGLKYPIAIIA